jgi:predicted transcriptional regulator
MFTVELPYDTGTFMKVLDKDKNVEYCGTVCAYTVVNQNDYAIWVSGYKEAVTGEFLPDQLEPMTEEEIQELKKKYEEVNYESSTEKEI